MESAETTTFIPDTDDATKRWEEFEAALDEIPEDGSDDDFLSVDIPVKSSTVNLRSLHPKLHERLRRAFADPRISSTARVSSAVRTYEQQKYLYAKYGRGRAANPDFVRSDGRRGSAHMIQPATFRYAGGFEPGSFGYAVDVGFWGTQEWDLLRRVMGENGLRLTVFRPFEPWHFELDPDGRHLAAPTFGLPVSGSGVADVQRLLAARHADLPNTIPDPGAADGALGPKTEAAIVAWQKLVRVEADGSWGPMTERATAAWMFRRNRTLRIGSLGDDVREIQRYLTECHRKWPDDVPDPGGQDGHFGQMTETAAQAWQTKLGIDSDGVWGPATWEASDRYDDLQRT